MKSSLAALAPTLLPPAMAVAVMLLGAHVALDTGRRVRTLEGAARNPWLAASALALATGLWSAQVLTLSTMLTPVDAGFAPGLAIIAALAGLVLGAAGLSLWFVSQPSWTGVIGGAALLATAALLTQATLLASLGLSPGIRWNPGWLALGWGVAAIGLVVAAVLHLAPAGRGRAAPWRPWRCWPPRACRSGPPACRR
jgi:NO-binding membrane sensor protein with MHYT domain